MFSFTADPFLLRLAQRLEGAPARVHEDAARELEGELEALLERQFAAARDPYGRPYLPPKDGHRPPMTRSGRLRRGLGVRCTPGWGGIRVDVTSGAEYAKYLQSGTSRMAPRLIVPGRSMLAPEWREAALRAYQRAIGRWLGQG